MVKVGQEVKIAYGVYYEGYDLSDLTGTIVDTTSYVLVWIPTLKIKAKLFQSEICKLEEQEPFLEMLDDYNL